MEEKALTFFNADGVAVAEHFSVDGEEVVADLEAVWVVVRKRFLHGALASLFEVFHCSWGREEVLCHVTAAAQAGLELLHGEEDLAVVVAGIFFWFDVNGTDEAGVLARAQIGSGAYVRVVEAEA